ncbi:urease accessory protein UreE [Halarchaeum sp. P4]|uniref:urease accessory protein UreE n=1 Tax=Halarchaeum sp. P4 TaxID=3421639 RepID=UPI003EB737DF
MELYDTYLGNTTEDDGLASRVETEGARRLTLDETTRRRSRFRTETADGTDVGVVATNAGSLEPGDVFAGDDGLLVVGLADRDALVVDLGDATATPETLALAAKFGHVVGNRHRDLAVRGSDVLVALEEDVERHRAEIDSHLPAGATIRVEGVDPTLFDDATPDHAHGDAGDEHSHGDEGHTHSHGDEHTHTHGEDGHTHGSPGGVRMPGGDAE